MGSITDTGPRRIGGIFYIKIYIKILRGFFTRTMINNQKLRTNVPENNKSKNTGKFVQDILLKIRRLIRKRGRSRNSSNIEESTRYIKVSPSGLEYYSKIRYSRSRPRGRKHRRMPSNYRNGP